MHILTDRSAVKFISKTDLNTNAEINYYKTYSCNEPNFNTKNQDHNVHINDFMNITKEEYQEFISTWEKENKNIQKQIKRKPRTMS